MRKKYVGIFCGGNSIESEYSLRSAARIKEILQAQGHESVIIDIADTKNMLAKVAAHKMDLAYLVMYGVPGQEGSVHGLLELCGIKYTGSDLTACAIIKDKIFTKLTAKALGLNTPRYAQISKTEVSDIKTLKRKVSSIGGFPAVVKPVRCGGLSKGISIVKSIRELAPAVREAFRYDRRVMIEEHIAGDEITVCVLERGGNLNILPYVGIKYGGDAGFSTYKDKVAGKRILEIPAKLEFPRVKRAVDDACRTICKTLECKDYVYLDFIIRKTTPYLIEMGAVPGFLPSSNLPQAAANAGIPLSKIVSSVLRASRK